MLAVLLAVVFVLLGRSVALAYPAPAALETERYATVCPPRLPDYVGSDGAQRLLTEIEQSRSDECVRAEQRYAATGGGLTALHGDLWVVAGTVVAVFVGAEVLRKLWP